MRISIECDSKAAEYEITEYCEISDILDIFSSMLTFIGFPPVIVARHISMDGEFHEHEIEEEDSLEEDKDDSEGQLDLQAQLALNDNNI